ncbi:hypothetical protein [Thiomicrorhabdus lithotrophica]|uniref:Uncharacterized protein n=1 Tax=Thiomicrorhabdus lithotrophica TaxID=2949997 RepID=A0ABY8CC68_9GAMM|nr:hypothetical protein [Thiomicrorhabdus lithotrophica]WEJ62146.1 hypothetical protein NR989_09010 [Thiomicrorhabdus lithotrophica]
MSTLSQTFDQVKQDAEDFATWMTSIADTIVIRDGSTINTRHWYATQLNDPAAHYLKIEVDAIADNLSQSITNVENAALHKVGSGLPNEAYTKTESDSTFATKSHVDALTGKTIATGSATFTNLTNNIALTGVGIGVEVGDVITVTGSTSNDKEFTIEVITDDNNVIVNQAHANGTTSKSLVDETATVTVSLLCKWYLAPVGLGQGWVDVTANRSYSVGYTNNTKRAIEVKVITNFSTGVALTLTIDSIAFMSSRVTSSQTQTYEQCAKIPSSIVYSASSGVSLLNWVELR